MQSKITIRPSRLCSEASIIWHARDQRILTLSHHSPFFASFHSWKTKPKNLRCDLGRRLLSSTKIGRFGRCGCATALGLDGLCTGPEGVIGVSAARGGGGGREGYGFEVRVSVCVRWWPKLGVRMWAIWGWERRRRGDGQKVEGSLERIYAYVTGWLGNCLGKL